MKLGVAVDGEVRREWTVDPGVVWWGRAVRDDAYTLEIRDRFATDGRSDRASVDPGVPLELARAQEVRLSWLTGDTVVAAARGDQRGLHHRPRWFTPR